MINSFYFSEQSDKIKTTVEAVFARMSSNVCKRDALLKWCGERLKNYVCHSFSILVFFV